MDASSVHTPTPTELNMFKVMANLEFVDLKKPSPTSHILAPVEEVADIFPNEVILEEDFQRPETPPRLPTPLRTPVVSPKEPRENQEDDYRPPPPEPRFDPFVEKAKELSNAEIVAEKEGLLLELQMLEKQGIFKFKWIARIQRQVPSRQLTLQRRASALDPVCSRCFCAKSM